jgi:O-antigen/teichoic acid export membrane protein
VSERRAILRNTGTSYAVRLLRGLSLLALTPYLFRKLGTASFGTWSVMFTITTVYGLIEFGFSAGIRKFVAELHAKGRRSELERLVRSAVTIMAAMGLLAALVSAALAVFGQGLAAGGDRHAYEIGVLIIGGATLVRLPFIAFQGALLGYERWDLANLGEILSVLAFTVGSVLALELGGGLVSLSVVYAVSFGAGGVLLALLLHRADPDLRLRPMAPDRESRRMVAHFGSFALLADSMTFIGQRMDTIVIAGIRGAAASAPFAAANRLVGGVQSLTLPFVFLLMPMVSALAARGQMAEAVRRWTLATRLALQLVLPVTLVLIIFADDFVDAWLGKDAGNAAHILIILMAIQIATSTAYPSEQVLVGLGRVRTVGLLSLLEGFSNLGISVVLVSAWGGIGAAWGTLVTSAIITPIKIPLACRAADTSVRTFLRPAVVVPLISSLPAVAAMVAVRLVMDGGVVRFLVGAALGCGLAAAVGLWQVGGISVVRARLRRRTATA